MVQGVYYVAAPSPAPGALLVGVAAIAAGVLLLVGFLTAVVGAGVAAGVVAVALSLFPPCVPTLFDSRVSLIFGLAILMAIVGLGPGAFSVDARLFGRREIIIPRRNPEPEE